MDRDADLAVRQPGHVPGSRRPRRARGSADNRRVKALQIDDRRKASSATSQTLPPDLVAEASRRLPWLGLLFSLTYLLHRVGQRAVAGLTGAVQPGLTTQDVFDVAAVLLGIVVFVLSRSDVLNTRQKLQLGTVFQV